MRSINGHNIVSHREAVPNFLSSGRSIRRRRRLTPRILFGLFVISCLCAMFLQGTPQIWGEMF
jgi:hypothetical protein